MTRLSEDSSVLTLLRLGFLLAAFASAVIAGLVSIMSFRVLFNF